ncbi:IPTL-CTERM sorting domain-containing protein [Delftia acidovorans]|uniref:IPTL-CTERM sorting domain-containing protein n=1 Tax=Delftia acidovorans TaxID=80866 RepID=UPI0035A0F90E
MNASYPRYQEFRTGETNVVITDVSIRIFDSLGTGFPLLKLCGSPSENCQQLDHKETVGNVYSFTGSYQASANKSVRIIFDCNCDGGSGYGVYFGLRSIPGASSNAPGYQFAVKVDAIALPTITRILPSSGPTTGNTQVRLDGTGLLDAAGIKFGDTDALQFQMDSDTQITAVSPAHASGTVGIKLVTTANGAYTNGDFTYVAAPAITAIHPIAGPTAGGTPVILTGSGFTSAAPSGAVQFGSTAANYTVNSDTQITAIAPPGAAGTVEITVSTIGGNSASSIGDRFTYVAAPAITAIHPIARPTAGGTPVILTGSGFTSAAPSGAVQFGSTAANYTVNSDTQITATAPPGAAGTVDITVSTIGGNSASSIVDRFTYVAAPAITAIHPIAGPTAGGTPVILTGSGFTSATPSGAVQFGSTAANYTVNSDTQITAIAPPGAAGTVDITVSTVGGTSATSAGDRFTYAQAPTTASITPTTGPSAGGTQITLTGTHLSAASTVKFGNQSATGVSVVSDTQLTAISPPGTGTVDLTVTTPGGTSAITGTARFSYAGVPSITGLSTQHGPVAGGTQVLISGSGFTAATSVKFGTAEAAGFTVDSATRITANAPPGSSGIVSVSVTTPEGTSPASAVAQFRYQLDSASLLFPEGELAMHLSGADCGFEGMPTKSAPPPTGLPSGFGFPYGQIAFQAGGCTSGGTLRVALTLPKDVPAGTQLYKLINGQWLKWDAQVSGADIVFSVTDNDGNSTAQTTGDNDPTPGRIDDPIMVAVPLLPATPAAVPALGHWSLTLLSLLFAGLLAGGWRAPRS